MSLKTYRDIPIPREVIRMKHIDGIKLTVTNYVYRPGRVHIRKRVSDETYKDFTIFMAATLAAEVINAIDQQTYKKSWKPLSLYYYTWKAKHHLSLNIWEATGHMKNSIKCFKRADYIAVGFKQNEVYPKTYAHTNRIARYLEFGSKRKPGHPPSRPLWRPTLERVSRNVSRYYKQYRRELRRRKLQYLYL